MTTDRAMDAYRQSVLAIEQSKYRHGFIGRIDSSAVSGVVIDVPGRPGYVYVRIVTGGNSVTVDEAYNEGAMRNPNIMIRMERRARAGLVIIGAESSSAVAVLGDRAPSATVPPHSHAIASGNPDMVEGLRFVPGVIRLSDLGGLYVYAEPFQYDGGYWPGGNLALTPPGTSNMQAWCAVAFNPADGTLAQFTGAEYALPVLLGGSELAQVAITPGFIPLGGVVLQNGQTAITGAEVWGDLRYHFAQAGGDISGVVILAPTSATRNTVQPSGDHPALILKNNAGQTDAPFQVQTSAGAVMAQIGATGGLIVNEQGADADTRIEGDTDANLVFVDASTDRVGIGTNAPAAKLHVEGSAVFNDAGADVDFRVEGDTAANLLFADASQDAVGINQSSIAASAVLDIASTTKGMLIPRVTTTQRDAISSPAAGLLVYNTSTSAFNFYNGSSWAAVGGGGGSLTVKEVDGTPVASSVDTLVVSNGTLTDDGGGQVTITIAGGSTPYSLCQGRLTLTSGTPVTTSDVTAATTIYFTPYKGNQIGLYSGAMWNLFAFSEISLSLSGYTADENYDIWVYDNSGTVTLDSTVWTNDTTRATALAMQDGVYVKSGDATRRYLGTIRTTSTTGQTEDSEAKRYVWNCYNRANRALRQFETNYDWTYSSTTWRQARASTSNQVNVVVGVAESIISLSVVNRVSVSGSGQSAQIAFGEDSTTTVATESTIAQNNYADNSSPTLIAQLTKPPAAGHHYYVWLESGWGSGTQTWKGTSDPYRRAGITGFIDA